jgi:DNA-binding transcriptional regulator YiaG
MTGAEFRAARRKLGLSLSQCAEVLQLGREGTDDRWRQAGRTIRKWEAGDNEIPGPARVLMRWLAFGAKPKIPK